VNPGPPAPPQPPHDPYSLLLNGRIGFQQNATAPGDLPAVIDPDGCALVLPAAAAGRRDLAEPSGSLGGLRPPSNVALGSDGSIYLLDRAHHRLKRFDPCECAFVQVPCIAAEGGESRGLRNAGDIAIACGNLYVCDTGLETAAAGGECEDQAAADARVQRENHRVSVFGLRGFALRGHLLPPMPERPWRPVTVAVDSLGRVWVGDARGKIHRFTPRGWWEGSWPIVPPPAHLAVDCRDRLYVVAAGASAAVRVFDSELRLVSPQPVTPADARTWFPSMPFEVDAQGRLFLERLCVPRDVPTCKAPGPTVFDDGGNPVDGLSTSVSVAYETAATYRSGPLDSGIAQCVWHRVSLFGSLPTGTRIVVRAFCADERLEPTDLDALATWHTCAAAEAFDDGGQWDCLVRGEPGRYLWLELRLHGNGNATPSVGAIIIEFPRISVRRFLPSVFGMEPVSADFADRFLALFDTPLRRIERQVDRMAAVFDPLSAPAFTADPRRVDFLSWLGTWIGITVDRNWDVETRRRFVKRAGALFDRRGTVRGLREQLLLLLGFAKHAPCAEEPRRGPDRCVPGPLNCGPAPDPRPPELPPLVLEHFRLRRWLRLGRGHLGDAAVIWGEGIVGRTRLGKNGQAGVTRLDGSPDPARDPFLVHANQFSVFVPARCRTESGPRRALESLVRTEAPAGTRGYLHFVEPRFRIGIQSMLGFDSVVAALPQGVTLGETPLGGASILTAPPYRQGGPPIAIGKEGRVGTTTRLG
jgi:phage tail-like protein